MHGVQVRAHLFVPGFVNTNLAVNYWYRKDTAFWAAQMEHTRAGIGAAAGEDLRDTLFRPPPAPHEHVGGGGGGGGVPAAAASRHGRGNGVSEEL